MYRFEPQAVLLQELVRSNDLHRVIKGCSHLRRFQIDRSEQTTFRLSFSGDDQKQHFQTFQIDIT